MTTYHATDSWRCLYIYPEYTLYIHGAHIVGPSPCHSLLEVAVPSQQPVEWPYQDLCSKPSVSVESPVPQDKFKQYGLGVRGFESHFNLTKNIRQGISQYGMPLANYFLQRYSCMVAWIQYCVLFHDISVCSLQC